DQQIDRAGYCINRDDVAGLDKSDRTSLRRLGANMPNAKSSCSTRESPVSYQRNLLAHALAIECCSGREHFAHARAAFGTLIANDNNGPCGNIASFKSYECIFFAIKHSSESRELQSFEAGHLYNRTLRRERTLEPHNAAGRWDGTLGRRDDF